MLRRVSLYSETVFRHEEQEAWSSRRGISRQAEVTVFCHRSTKHGRLSWSFQALEAQQGTGKTPQVNDDDARLATYLFRLLPKWDTAKFLSGRGIGERVTRQTHRPPQFARRYPTNNSRRRSQLRAVKTGQRHDTAGLALSVSAKLEFKPAARSRVAASLFCSSFNTGRR